MKKYKIQIQIENLERKKRFSQKCKKRNYNLNEYVDNYLKKNKTKYLNYLGERKKIQTCIIQFNELAHHELRNHE